MSEIENPFNAVNGDVCCGKCRRPLRIDGVIWGKSGEIVGVKNPHCVEHASDTGTNRVWTGHDWYPSDIAIEFQRKCPDWTYHQ